MFSYIFYIFFFLVILRKINRLEKILGDFLWGNYEEGRKMYAMNWVKVCNAFVFTYQNKKKKEKRVMVCKVKELER